mgnify:FL=1
MARLRSGTSEDFNGTVKKTWNEESGEDQDWSMSDNQESAVVQCLMNNMVNDEASHGVELSRQTCKT